MPERDHIVFLEDILEATAKIATYTTGLSYESFTADGMRVDAVVRNLLVIGEAAGKVPDEIRARRPSVDWRKMKALRNILVHEYFGIDLDVVWDIIENHLPQLRRQVEAMLREEKSE